jgi:neutral ceramidase
MSDAFLNYRAGAATVCITPNEPLWLAGYAVRKTPGRDKISDLYASALALEDETGRQFVIASADFIAINRDLADRIFEKVREQHALSRDQLLLVATHSHYAPEYRPDKALFFHIPPEYAAKLPAVAERLATAIAQAIDQALARFEPVRLIARKAAAGFAHNRRRRGVKAGKPSTEDTLDHDVPILDCIDQSGKRKAIVFGYACHCTTIEPEDSRFCGDWAGFAKQHLQETNTGATTLFIPGPGADQDPEPRGSLELSRQYGRELAASIQQALNAPGIEIRGPLRIGWQEISLPLEPVTRDGIEKMLHADDPPQNVKAKFLLDQMERGEKFITEYSVPLQVVRLGSELLLIGMSGEPVIDWAHKFKQHYSSLQPLAHSPQLIWVAGYCNDVFDYVPTRRIQAEGGYEGGRANLWNWIPTPFTGDVEDRITDAIHRLVEHVSK